MSPGRPKVLGPGPVLDTSGCPRASLVTREMGVSLAMTPIESYPSAPAGTGSQKGGGVRGEDNEAERERYKKGEREE